MASKTLYFDIIGRDKSGSAAIQKVGAELLVFGAAAGAAVGLAVKKFADFDAQMSQVKTLSHATGAEMTQLTDAALTLGQGIGFSANQVADAETELVKAGLSVKDIMGGALAGALDLAAAGQIDVGQATEIATIALTQFKLVGKDVPHVADLLAAGADKALGGVGDLGEALKSGGLTASQFGVSLDETVGTLAAFANAGRLGEVAGTDLRQLLLKLSNPSAEAAKTMKDLGINIYDASGKFIGMAGLAGQLHDKLDNLTPATRNAALATIFGAKAIAGANILYEQGAAGIQKWTDEVNDTGFAAQQARGKMDNLNGDVKKLGAAFDTALIKSGSSANDTLRELTQSGTGLVQAFANAPEPVQKTAFAVGAGTAAVALFAGGMLIAIPKIESFRQSLRRLSADGVSVGKIIGKGGLLTLGVMAFAGAVSEMGVQTSLSSDEIAQLSAVAKKGGKDLDKEFVDAYGNVSNLKDSLKEFASGNFWENYASGPQQLNGAIKAVTFGMVDLGAWANTDKAKFKELGQELSDVAKQDFGNATQKFKEYVAQAGGGKEAIRRLLEVMPDYKAELIELATAQGQTLTQQELFNLSVGKGKLAEELAATSTSKNSSALSVLSDTADDAGTSISDLADKIKDFGKGQLDVNSANRQFQQSIDDVTTTLQQQKDAYSQAHGSLDGFTASLDIGTQEGRDNSAALDSIASSALGAASAILTQTGNQDDATAAVQQGRDALIAALGQFGITGQAAQDYADKLGLIPGNVTTAAQLTGTQNVQSQFDALINRNDGRVIHALVDITGKGTAFIPGVGNVAFASGGDTDMAPGPKGVDSMLAVVAKGEHVLNTADVDAMGGQSGVYAFRRALHGVKSKAASIGMSSSSFIPRPYEMPARSASATSGSGASSSAPTNVNIRVTQKVAGVSLRDLIAMEIETADGWQSLELESGVGR